MVKTEITCDVCGEGMDRCYVPQSMKDMIEYATSRAADMHHGKIVDVCIECQRAAKVAGADKLINIFRKAAG